MRIGGLTYDWDVWPALVMEGAGVSVEIIALGRRINRVALEIGLSFAEALVPLAKFVASYRGVEEMR